MGFYSLIMWITLYMNYSLINMVLKLTYKRLGITIVLEPLLKLENSEAMPKF